MDNSQQNLKDNDHGVQQQSHKDVQETILNQEISIKSDLNNEKENEENENENESREKLETKNQVKASQDVPSARDEEQMVIEDQSSE